MEKFLLIARKSPQKTLEHNPDQASMDVAEMQNWVQSLIASGNYHSGSAINDVENRRVSKHYTITNYEYTEINPVILGYDIILANNLQQAVMIAGSCPMLMKGQVLREVRQILPLLR
jgi:hypothetical protein